MSKEAYYFSHDDNARNDIKIRAMRKRYGMAGYGRWWVLIELLRSEEDHKLPHKDFTYIALADEFDCDEQEARKFVKDLIETFDLMHSDEDFFWSESLNRRMDKRQESIEQRREAGRASAAKRAKNSKKMNERSTTVQRKSTSDEQGKERKGKEIKEKEIKEREAPPAPGKTNNDSVEVNPDSEKEKSCAKKEKVDWNELARKACEQWPDAAKIDTEEIEDAPSIKTVSEEMLIHYETPDGNNEWELMCASVGISSDAVDKKQLCLSWALKADQNKLKNWKHHTTKLGAWIRNAHRDNVRENPRGSLTVIKNNQQDNLEEYGSYYEKARSGSRAG